MAEPHQIQPKDHDVYRAASRAVDEDDEWPEYAKRKFPKGLKKLLKIAAIIIVILVLAGASYEIFKHHKTSKPAFKTSTSTTQPKPASSGHSNGTSQYTANGSDLNLSFSYPSNWTVSPASGTDTTNQTITISSPSTSIQSADGSSVTGKATVSIRAGSAAISELNSGNPMAAANSTQFAYNAPTPDQHQYPYLTFIHFTSGSQASGAFEEVMITGVQLFTKGQQVSSDSLGQLDPIISVSFYKCNDTACAGQGAGLLSISSNTWQNDQLFINVQNLFASLKLS